MTPEARPFASLAMVLLVGLAVAGCFPREAGPRLGHFDEEAPAPGEPAPDFTLAAIDGDEVRLSGVLGEKPVVLQFGSHTCPVYRNRHRGMRRLWERYGDRVRFYVVYTREAHPMNDPSPYTGEEWDVWINKFAGVRLEDPDSYAERRDLAEESKRRLEIPLAMLVDDMENTAWRLYGSAPSPAFVIDRDGEVVLRQVWIRPAEIEAVLRRLLAEERGASDASEKRGREIGRGGFLG